MSGYESRRAAREVLDLSIQQQSHGDTSLPATTKAYHIGALFDECFYQRHYGWGITDAGLDLATTARKHLRKGA